MDHPVYPISKTLEDERLRLERENFGEDIEKVFISFIDELSVNNITEFRQYFYLVRLRLVARQMGHKVLSPTKEDIKNLIAGLKKVKTQRGRHYSENSITDFVTTLKKFYKWHEDGKYLDSVKWISSRTMPSHVEKPDFVITEDEIKKLVYACQNTRDKALISTLYDSGCRISEVLTLKIKDVEFDEYGAFLLVHGKTGNRWVRVVGNSVPLLHEHMGPRDEEEYIFQGLEGDAKGKIMSYPQVAKVLRSAERRGQLKRHIHPHLFRHTRATLLAANMNEAPLETQMGWKHGSRMTQTYVHFSKADLDKAVLRAYGIEIPDQKPGTGERMPRKCERCSELNETEARFCKRCGLPLTRADLEKMESKVTLMSETMASSGLVHPGLSKMLVSSMSLEAKTELAAMVAEMLGQNPEDVERFGEEYQKRKKEQQ